MKRNGCGTSHTQLESNELGIVKIIETQTVIGKHTQTHTHTHSRHFLPQTLKYRSPKYSYHSLVFKKKNSNNKQAIKMASSDRDGPVLQPSHTHTHTHTNTHTHTTTTTFPGTLVLHNIVFLIERLRCVPVFGQLSRNRWLIWSVDRDISPLSSERVTHLLLDLRLWNKLWWPLFLSVGGGRGSGGAVLATAGTQICASKVEASAEIGTACRLLRCVLFFFVRKMRNTELGWNVLGFVRNVYLFFQFGLFFFSFVVFFFRKHF